MAPEFLVLGAGPSGCTVSTFLARAGHSVCMVDRHDPPIVNVGESLLPYVAPVLAELGVDMSGFQEKRGAVFYRDGQAARFGFDEGLRHDQVLAWQTPRVELDRRLRAVATAAGVQFVKAGVNAIDLERGVAHTDVGELAAGFFIDAGGRNQLLARQLGLRTKHPTLKNAAMGAWHKGIERGPQEEPGDLVLAAYEGGWFWMIPFVDGTWSVGTVTTTTGPRGPDRFAEALARCSTIRDRLQGSERLEPFRGASDISVGCTRMFGDNWALLGDSATFLDPIFSTGIALGLHAGKQLAAALHAGEPLGPWEKACRDAVAGFEPLVDSFYDGSFLDVVFADPERHQTTVRQALVSLLAGDVFDPGFTAPRRLGARMQSIRRIALA